MHTKWLALGLIFGLNTATQAEIALNESADSVVSVLQQSKYWGLIQPGTACVEQYQFLPSGDVIIDSNKEHVTGRYQYIESAQGFNLPALVLTVVEMRSIKQELQVPVLLKKNRIRKFISVTIT
jgi:hypothetical protein